MVRQQRVYPSDERVRFAGVHQDVQHSKSPMPGHPRQSVAENVVVVLWQLVEEVRELVGVARSRVANRFGLGALAYAPETPKVQCRFPKTHWLGVAEPQARRIVRVEVLVLSLINI